MTTNDGLEMDYSFICGRRFATERGMKIHRTKMGCFTMLYQQQRTAVADKTLENQSQVQNDSAKEIQAENRDDVLRHSSSDKRQKINFSPASSGMPGQIWTAKLSSRLTRYSRKAPWSTSLPLTVISSIKSVWPHLERKNTKPNAHYREAGGS
ncbi:reverse transcriptase [Plakobranchus ocellatus]|uniref:Reverse transcriptase n=1 Tax=Plakobranchus ocellatus TaxID=259542 RepID=A0AAV3Z6H4_9GAST|nr:reverse transcriptase [Plakobranchus ocellatus]